jgi:hypothetical protein
LRRLEFEPIKRLEKLIWEGPEELEKIKALALALKEVIAPEKPIKDLKPEDRREAG